MLFLVILFLFSFSLLGQDIQSLFQTANEFYQEGDYQHAVSAYLQVLGQGYQSPAIYYNLGNCYFRMEQIGEAVLYYEKGLKLDPHDPDIQFNLELANLRVVDRIELPPKFFLFSWWDNLKVFYSIGQLTRLVLILFGLAILLIILRLFVRRYRFRSWLISSAIISGVLFFLWLYVLIVRVNEFNNIREGVILSPNVTVLSAPDENSTDMFLLHEGVKVQLDDQREYWVKINLPDGKSGWVKTEDLGII
jgi:tetratricopeptide (TPR) repeat protein